ncbi:MAG: Rnf-Nqr domain containing protein [bacterium]
MIKKLLTRLIIGYCPTLVVTNTMVNGLAMGLATAFFYWHLKLSFVTKLL